MLGTHYAEILRQEGFHLVGDLNYRLRLTVWWHPASDKLQQVIVFTAGDAALIKGDKSYHLKSVSAEGETWARDIGALHTYLETHFPELRIAFSHFRDMPPDLAGAEVRRRIAVEAPTQSPPSVEELALLQRELAKSLAAEKAFERMTSQLTPQADLLTGYLRRQGESHRADSNRLREELDRKRERAGLFQHLQREYQQKGSAAAYTFNISSNVQVADNVESFRDALRAIVKELSDMHRYQSASCRREQTRRCYTGRVD